MELKKYKKLPGINSVGSSSSTPGVISGSNAGTEKYVAFGAPKRELVPPGTEKMNNSPRSSVSSMYDKYNEERSKDKEQDTRTNRVPDWTISVSTSKKDV